jgi:hypothetical protein
MSIFCDLVSWRIAEALDHQFDMPATVRCWDDILARIGKGL